MSYFEEVLLSIIFTDLSMYIHDYDIFTNWHSFELGLQNMCMNYMLDIISQSAADIIYA